jgi:hypothetical protein
LLCLIAWQDEDHLPGLRAALAFLGGPTAEMNSHFTVLVDFIARVWQSGNVLGWLKIRAVTGLSLETFLGNRNEDWRFWLQQILDWGGYNRRLTSYLLGWLQGHFLTKTNGSASNASAAPHKNRRRKAA